MSSEDVVPELVRHERMSSKWRMIRYVRDRDLVSLDRR